MVAERVATRFQNGRGELVFIRPHASSGVEKLLQGSRSTIRVGTIYGGRDESNERRGTPSVGSECKEGSKVE